RCSSQGSRRDRRPGRLPRPHPAETMTAGPNTPASSTIRPVSQTGFWRWQRCRPWTIRCRRRGLAQTTRGLPTDRQRKTQFVAICINTSVPNGGSSMDHITIRVSNIDFAKLQHHAHAHGRTGVSVITEWARVLVEYPDDAMRMLAKLVSELPSVPKEHECRDDLDVIRRRAGLQRRRRRDEN